MIQIFLTIVAVITSLFLLGFGPAFFLTPKKLKEHILWLIPWYGVMSLIVILTIVSRMGVSISLASPIVITLLLMNGIYIYLKKKPSFNIKSLTNFVYSKGHRPMDVIPSNLDGRTLYVNFKEIKLE